MSRTAVLVFAVVLALSGCGGSGDEAADVDEVDPAAELYGEWATGYGNRWNYKEDGTWTFTFSDRGDPSAWGTYTFDGQTLSYTAEKSNDCGDGSTGIYSISFPDSETMVLALTDDACAPRAGDATRAPFVRTVP